jgi:hypothetical protein
MKKFLLGILSIYVLQTALTFGWHYGIDNDRKDLTSISFRTLEILKGTPIVDVLTSRCTKDMGRKTTRREWFNCNGVQVFFSDLIYGEFTEEQNEQ